MTQEETIGILEVFSEQEAETLVMSFIRSKGELATTAEEVGATDEEIEDFLSACLAAKVLSYSIDLAARGKVYIHWDPEARLFQFFPIE